MAEKRSSNLCSTYMLPLVSLGKQHFGVNNFINSYVDETDRYVIVELQQIFAAIKTHQNFKFSFIRDSSTFCVFEVPTDHRKAVELFREGKYSLFPVESKKLIIKHSGLAYNKPMPNGKRSTARELLALEKDVRLRETLERELNEKIHPDAELASIPGEECYYELKLSNELVVE